MSDPSLKLFILLMERAENNNWFVSRDILDALTDLDNNNKIPERIGLKDFLDLSSEEVIDQVALFDKVGKDFAVCNFRESKQFNEHNYESSIILKNNKEFVKELYNMLDQQLSDPEIILEDFNNFQSFADCYARIGLDLGLLPRLFTLKEFLLLVLEVKGLRASLTKTNMNIKKDFDKFLDLEELKVLVLLFAKFAVFKYGEETEASEEAFLQDLLWLLFLQLVNNPEFNVDDSLKAYNHKRETNLFYKLESSQVRPQHQFEETIIPQLEELFIVFANHFSKLQNPHLVLDIKKLCNVQPFKSHSVWIKKFVNSPSSDFSTFIQVLKYVLDQSQNGLSYQRELDLLLEELNRDLPLKMGTNYLELPTLDFEIVNQCKKLFKKYAFDKEFVYAREFFFFCKNSDIIPLVFSNKETLILFYQCNIRKLVRFCDSLSDFFNEKNFYYISLDDFVRLLLEIAFKFVEGMVATDANTQLKVLFKKVIKI